MKINLNTLRSIVIYFFPPIFLPTEEGIRLPRWSWDQLSRMTDQRRSFKTEVEDFHRCHAFKGIMQDETPVTHRTSPQPDISPAAMLVSLSTSPLFKGIHCVLAQVCFTAPVCVLR